MPQYVLRALAAVVALTALGPVSAADVAAEAIVVKPGDPTVDGSFIKPYTNAWRMKKISQSGEVEEVGRWTDEVTIDKADGDGGPILVRRQRVPRPGGYLIMVNRVRRNDLVPVSRQILDGEGTETLQHMDFDGARVRTTPAGQSEPVELSLDEEVFDWYLYGLLLVGFPLEQGYAARFPAMGGGGQLEWREFQVVGEESISARSGKQYDCWKVEVDDGLTFWVTRKAPYVITLTKGDNPDGSMMRWDME